MKQETQGILVRIFIGESDRHGALSLYETIVQEARRRNMAGATVLRGIMGFGASSRLHTARILRLSEDLPVVVEIVDTEARIREFMPFLDEVVKEGLITMEKVQVIRYRGSKQE